jgi:hypothetical protein
VTLNEALRILVEEEHLGDWVYDIRERALSNDPDFEGSSWDHPRVKRFGEVFRVIEAHVKATKE